MSATRHASRDTDDIGRTWLRGPHAPVADPCAMHVAGCRTHAVYEVDVTLPSGRPYSSAPQRLCYVHASDVLAVTQPGTTVTLRRIERRTP